MIFMHDYLVCLFLVLLFKKLALNDGTPLCLVLVPLLIDLAMAIRYSIKRIEVEEEEDE